MIYEQFRVIGSHDSVENFADLFTISLRNDDIQEFDSKWDGILLSMTKIPHDDILEGLYELRIRESEKLKTVLELYDQESQWWPGDGGPKACHSQAAADSQGSRTCVCAITFWTPEWHTQGRKDELTSCRGTVAKTSSETQRRKSRAARKGKWPPRGTGTTVLTNPRSAPRGTGKAGENGQNSGGVGGSSAWTRPSAPESGDRLTLEALAGDQRPI